MRVRATEAKAPDASSAVVHDTGTTMVSAPRWRAAISPARSPATTRPAPSASNGRSPSPSAETSASKGPWLSAQPRSSARVSSDTASVSTGTKVADRPSDTTPAPSAPSTSAMTSRATVECA